MKIPFLFLSIAGILLFTISTSCNKENTPPTPNQIDSIKNRLPKQVFISSTSILDTFPPYSFNGIISIKYDTTNLKIELYLNDTTNSDPDKLFVRYRFNNDGYLVSWIYNRLPTQGGYISIPDTVTIERSSDNRIRSIKNTSIIMEGGSPINFSYQSSGQNLIIKLEEPPFTQYYTFNADLKCVSLFAPSFDRDYHSDWTDTFLYNSSGSLDSTVSSGWNLILKPDLVTWEKAYVTIAEKILYSSGIPDGKEDLLMKTLLGKDYYMLSLYQKAQLYLFSMPFDESGVSSYYYSFTDPYHASQIISTYKNTFGNYFSSRTTDIKYELNNQGLLSLFNLISTGDGTNENTTLQFKY
jgi:hypothetical protein